MTTLPGPTPCRHCRSVPATGTELLCDECRLLRGEYRKGHAWGKGLTSLQFFGGLLFGAGMVLGHGGASLLWDALVK